MVKVEHGIGPLPRMLKEQTEIPADFPITVCKPGRAHGLERGAKMRARGGTNLPPAVKKKPKGTGKPKGTLDQMAGAIAFLKFGK